jgi:hypothetical protein
MSRDTPVTGGGKWVEISIPADCLYQHLLLTAEKKFWRCVESGEPPRLFGAEPLTSSQIRAASGGEHPSRWRGRQTYGGERTDRFVFLHLALRGRARYGPVVQIETHTMFV